MSPSGPTSPPSSRHGPPTWLELHVLGLLLALFLVAVVLAALAVLALTFGL